MKNSRAKVSIKTKPQREFKGTYWELDLSISFCGVSLREEELSQESIEKIKEQSIKELNEAFKNINYN
jgi:hypothetical protein